VACVLDRGDARMSDGRGQEYLDENFCSHDDVYIDDFYVIEEIVKGKKYMNDVHVSIRCQNCGKTQERTLDLEQIIDDLDLGWVE